MGLGAGVRALIALTIAAASLPARETSLADWLRAIDAHQPGAIDGALEIIAATPPQRLTELQGDLRRHIQTRIKQGRGIEIGQRAAMLHFDVAAVLHVRGGGRPDMPATPPGSPRTFPVPSDYGSTIIVNDGIVTGYDRAGFHWRFGRGVLFALASQLKKPDEAVDGFTRLWYRAASAVMSNLMIYSELQPHLTQALSLWPRESWVHLDRGAMAECLSAPRIQAALRSVVLPGSTAFGVGSERTELEMAERHLRVAVEIEPSLVTARLRLGRVLSLSGRHEDALGHLAHAAEAQNDPQTRYFAHLFSGRSYEALGKRDRARQAYLAAAALFPHAQAPALSLRQLDGRPGAQRSLEQVLMRPDVDENDDPWWTYHVWHRADGDAIVGRLRASVPAAISQ